MGGQRRARSGTGGGPRLLGAVAGTRRVRADAIGSDLGVEVALTSGAGVPVSLSPDGTMVAFVGLNVDGGGSRIYLRRLTQLQATPLQGTDTAQDPFFSPDSQWIGFFAGGKLKKIAVTGGAAVTVCDVANGRGGTWSEDGTILFFAEFEAGCPLDARVGSGWDTCTSHLE